MRPGRVVAGSVRPPNDSGYPAAPRSRPPRPSRRTISTGRRLNTSTADITDAAPIAQWRFSGIAGINSPAGLEEHDRQAVGGEAWPLITRVAGAYGRAVESSAGDLLLQDLGKAAQV